MSKFSWLDFGAQRSELKVTVASCSISHHCYISETSGKYFLTVITVWDRHPLGLIHKLMSLGRHACKLLRHCFQPQCGNSNLLVSQWLFKLDNTSFGTWYSSMALATQCVCLTAIQICLRLNMYDGSSRGESHNSDHRLLTSWGFVSSENRQIFHMQDCNN